MLGEGAWDDVVKFSVRRTRPTLFPYPYLSSFSYPSGHAMATLCVAGVLLIVAWPHLGRCWRWLLGLTPPTMLLRIGLSQVYLGVHYPSDVTVPTPARTSYGRPLGIWLILGQKTLWGLVLVALGAVLLTLRVGHVTQPLQALFAGELAEDPHDLLGTLLTHLVPAVSPRTELLLGVGALAYAALEGLEVWGLWRDLLWVEILVVVETAAFLPYEVWELTRHLTVFKVASLIINVLIVWYLVARYLRKREERLLREVEAVVEGRTSRGKRSEE